MCMRSGTELPEDRTAARETRHTFQSQVDLQLNLGFSTFAYATSSSLSTFSRLDFLTYKAGGIISTSRDD